LGRVWLADNEKVDRRVALKKFKLSEQASENTRKARERALREARSAARVDHIGAVKIYDIVRDDGCP